MQNFEQLLYEEFPDFFDRATLTPFSERGFEVGPGWYALIRELVQKLEEQAFLENRTAANSVKCAQCKEKFGLLRVYLMNSSDNLFKIKHAYEERSARVCCECGVPGRQYKTLGMAVYCRACRKHAIAKLES